jgi:hypothetical protein
MAVQNRVSGYAPVQLSIKPIEKEAEIVMIPLGGWLAVFCPLELIFLDNRRGKGSRRRK